MEKFNQAISLLWPADLEQKISPGQREEDEDEVLTQHKPIKQTIKCLEHIVKTVMLACRISLTASIPFKLGVKLPSRLWLSYVAL